MSFITLNKSKVPVGTIYGMWKTYPKHAREMRQMESEAKAPVAFSDDPVVFSKPASSISYNGEYIKIPIVNGKPLSENLQYEVELVLLVGKTASNVPENEALTYISGYGIGLDMTLRDVQLEAKKNGLPWLTGKGFKTSAVVSDFVQLSTHSPYNLTIELQQNRKTVQYAPITDMGYSLEFLISYLSEIFILEAGDLIFTGTPEGSGKCVTGDVLAAQLKTTEKNGTENSSGSLIASLETKIA